MEAELVKHEEQIKTLFNSVADIKGEVAKIHDLALQIATLSQQIEQLSRSLIDNNTLLERQIEGNTQRIRGIEEERKFKSRYIWQTVIGTILGGVVGYLLTVLIK